MFLNKYENKKNNQYKQIILLKYIKISDLIFNI
jgi:hypothetical protein